jgi:hypothetical protein
MGGLFKLLKPFKKPNKKAFLAFVQHGELSEPENEKKLKPPQYSHHKK